MKFSKAYYQLVSDYSDITRKANKEISEIEAALPKIEAEKAEAVISMKAAAAEGNAEAYSKAKTSESYYIDRLQYLNERKTALESKPLAERKDIEAMLSVLGLEEEKLRREIETGFKKKFLALYEECEDYISALDILLEGKKAIRQRIGKDTGTHEAQSIPGILGAVERMTKTAVAQGILSIPDATGSPHERILTGKQRTEYQTEHAKWE